MAAFPCAAQVRPPAPQGAVAGDLVYPQAARETQIDVTPHLAPASSADRMLVPLAVEYGITGVWQVVAQVTGVAPRTVGATRLTSVEVGVRRSWMHVGRSNAHAAVGLDVERELGAPTLAVAGVTGDDAQDNTGGVEVTPSLIVARDFPSLGAAHAFTHVAVGFTPRRTGGPALTPATLAWNTGLLVPVRHLWLSGELTADRPLGDARSVDHAERSVRVTPGVVWPVTSGWELAAGAPVHLTGPSAADRAVVRLTFEF